MGGENCESLKIGIYLVHKFNGKIYLLGQKLNGTSGGYVSIDVKQQRQLNGSSGGYVSMFPEISNRKPVENCAVRVTSRLRIF